MKCKNCEAYDTAFGCSAIKCNYFLSKRLAVYEEAEEQGLLVRLPCKVGDTVYVEWSEGREYSKSVVEKISIGADGQARFLIPAYLHSHSASWYQTSDFGKTVFLTLEEAEAALKELKEERKEENEL